jgi:hypothetical protein
MPEDPNFASFSKVKIFSFEAVPNLPVLEQLP